jgi:hypothetical protein
MMNSSTYRKSINISCLIGIGIIITMPDTVFGSLLELGHILFEFIEIMLDKFVEHIFHTDRHQTQVIVFYLMLFLAFSGLYYLWRVLPSLCRQYKENLLVAWSWHKTRAFFYWQEMPLINKTKLVVIVTSTMYLSSFIFM